MSFSAPSPAIAGVEEDGELSDVHGVGLAVIVVSVGSLGAGGTQDSGVQLLAALR